VGHTIYAITGGFCILQLIEVIVFVVGGSEMGEAVPFELCRRSRAKEVVSSMQILT